LGGQTSESPGWLAALLIALSGDVETNPGPITRENEGAESSAQTPTATLSPTMPKLQRFDETPIKKCRNTPPKLIKTKTAKQIDTTSKKYKYKQPQLTILQLNANGIRNKIKELKILADESKADIITIQETKLIETNRTPQLEGYATVRQDRKIDKGGGIITFISAELEYTNLAIPTFNKLNIEMQLIRLTGKKTKYHIANVYIPPRKQNANAKEEDEDITKLFDNLSKYENLIITGDFNAHSDMWHSTHLDHRGKTIQDIILNTDMETMNEDSPTRLSKGQNQNNTSPDITIVHTSLAQKASWSTLYKINSDHLPILLIVEANKIKKDGQEQRAFVNYKKANWKDFTQYLEDKLEEKLSQTNVQIMNKDLVKAIIEADRKYIPKGKIKRKASILPTEIRNKIDKRNEMRKNNSKDPNLNKLNEEINKDIRDHHAEQWKNKLGEDWSHNKNVNKLWSVIKSLKKCDKNSTNKCLQFDNKLSQSALETANLFNKQFTSAIKHKTKPENRKINREIQKLQGEEIKITSDEVKTAIKTTKTTYSCGPDEVNIHHLKHLGSVAVEFLTKMFNIALNSNTIPEVWKQAKIIPILKPNKDENQSKSYRPISILSTIAKTLEKILLPHITDNIPNNIHQHGFKKNHSTTTALHKLTNTITKGFNKVQPPKRTIAVAIDMSKAFDTVNHYKLLQKIRRTEIPNTVVKFLANYLKGRKGYTIYGNLCSKKKLIKTGVPQGGVLSPVLFNIYMSDFPVPPEDVTADTYADDITTTSTNTNYKAAESKLQPYLNKINEWTKDNDLKINPDKSTATLFTSDPAEYSNQLSLTLDNKLIPTCQHPKILGVTFDPKLTFNKHITNVREKAAKTMNILKSLTTTKYGKQKETIETTYKAITRPIIEYASTIWSPVTSETNIEKLQTVQNQALRLCTGCTRDTNADHLHTETKILPVLEHLKLHASNYEQKIRQESHPLNELIYQNTARNKKQDILNTNNNYTIKPTCRKEVLSKEEIQLNMKEIHTKIVNHQLVNTKINKIIGERAPEVDKSELDLPRLDRVRLSQLRTGKSPFLRTYLNKVDQKNYPSDLCPLCKKKPHTTQHIFECEKMRTELVILDLWKQPVSVAALLAAWEAKIKGSTEEGNGQ
jgi:endonuclease/exonuclease/phosphatase (EEP) superfamily protein YafD